MSANRGICFKSYVSKKIDIAGGVAQLVRAHVLICMRSTVRVRSSLQVK